MTEPRQFGTRVRGGNAAAPGRPAVATATAAPAPAAWTPPAPAPGPAPHTYRPVNLAPGDIAGYAGGGAPRSKPRPMPEYPVGGYRFYRLWGYLPADAGRWHVAVDYALGRPAELLYSGITSRAGFIRWAEHSDTKTWAGDVIRADVDESEVWPTLYDTLLDRQGRVILVFDDDQDDGVRPIRTDERVDPDPDLRTYRGEQVDVFTVDPAGIRLPGTAIEGARTGERRLIQAERPRHNIEHNQGVHAVQTVRRIVPEHVATQRRRGGRLALAWLVLAALIAWVLPAADLVAGIVAGALCAAAFLIGSMILAAATAGRPIRRRKPRTVKRPKAKK